MSLTSALSVALSGLQIASTQMQITSNNIANAKTPGYTEKTALISSQVSGSGDGGAFVSGFQRNTDAALTVAYNNATSQASFSSTEDDYLKQVQSLLNSNSSNPALSDAVAQFQSAWTQFSSDPSNAVAQNTVIQTGVNLASQIKTVASGVLSLSQQATSDINTTVSSLNADLAKVTSLNAQIFTAKNVGQPTGDLEDARDQAINAVAAITNVTVLQRPGDQIALYTPGGLLLLDGNSNQTFSFNGTDIISSTAQTVTTSLGGGSLAAEVNFLNGSSASADPGTGVIGKLNAQLQALTNALTDATAGSPETFAHAYNNATTGTGELAASFFTTDGSVSPASLAVNANLLNGTSTLKQASATPVSTALSATRSFSAASLNVSSGTYADLVTAILSGFQQAANTTSAQNTSAAQQQTYYQQALSNATGVNVDNELVNLTTLQNSYAASAHVISTINQMLADLENAI